MAADSGEKAEPAVLAVSKEAKKSRRVNIPERPLNACLLDSPLYSTLAVEHLRLCEGSTWPTMDRLNTLWPPGYEGGLSFVEQGLLNDALSYEQRISENLVIPTRARNWHDLFNAFINVRFPSMKRAINRRQAQGIRVVGAKSRDRSMAALAAFDECGVVLRCADAVLLEAYDAHDWPTLFAEKVWSSGELQMCIFGHSLYEVGLDSRVPLVAKAIVVLHPEHLDDAALDKFVAGAIDDGRVCADPQELRPLPLWGVPGWRERTPDFFSEYSHVFRPAREGRLYPAPLSYVDSV